jgi:Type II site-specific deoxyribonuclease
LPTAERAVFTPDFLVTLRGLIGVHQSIYPATPPQGIYFEALVEEAFRRIKKPVAIIEAGGKNQPRHDLLVEETRISIKSETGENTKPGQITITKLCTTEREPWKAEVLVARVMEHLSRYDVLLMLRTIWSPTTIHYQLVEIPVEMLRLIGKGRVEPVGHRRGRQSLGADVTRRAEKLFHVHFDASDGKCSVRGLGLEHCVVLEEWDVRR